ncbi:hypothetical protein AV530_000312 [Patagioenas fasciata monilis]|uniref:Uncharacterized protein n=1 Tax=Patagioenas fasciata monilis TaxID=372326 RepID=A0A1V4KDL5_PATFA|nr:hypothetical protein AV530_000312 [Patagioenas fasciata monilis]
MTYKTHMYFCTLHITGRCLLKASENQRAKEDNTQSKGWKQKLLLKIRVNTNSGSLKIWKSDYAYPRTGYTRTRHLSSRVSKAIKGLYLNSTEAHHFHVNFLK